MFSKSAVERKIGNKEGFRWRGEEITRIEGLSDAVFGFAVALLIVSTEVPKTFDALLPHHAGVPGFCGLLSSDHARLVQSLFLLPPI